MSSWVTQERAHSRFFLSFLFIYLINLFLFCSEHKPGRITWILSEATIHILCSCSAMIGRWRACSVASSPSKIRNAEERLAYVVNNRERLTWRVVWAWHYASVKSIYGWCGGGGGAESCFSQVRQKWARSDACSSNAAPDQTTPTTPHPPPWPTRACLLCSCSDRQQTIQCEPLHSLHLFCMCSVYTANTEAPRSPRERERERESEGTDKAKHESPYKAFPVMHCIMKGEGRMVSLVWGRGGFQWLEL